MYFDQNIFFKLINNLINEALQVPFLNFHMYWQHFLVGLVETVITSNGKTHSEYCVGF